MNDGGRVCDVDNKKKGSNLFDFSPLKKRLKRYDEKNPSWFSFLGAYEDETEANDRVDVYLDLVHLAYYLKTLKIPQNVLNHSEEGTRYVLKFIPDDVQFSKCYDDEGFSLHYAIMTSKNWTLYERTTRHLAKDEDRAVQCHHEVPLIRSLTGDNKRMNIDVKKDVFLSKSEMQKTCPRCLGRRIGDNSKKKPLIAHPQIKIKGRFPIVSKHVYYECVLTPGQTFATDDYVPQKNNVGNTKTVALCTMVNVSSVLSWGCVNRESLYDRGLSRSEDYENRKNPFYGADYTTLDTKASSKALNVLYDAAISASSEPSSTNEQLFEPFMRTDRRIANQLFPPDSKDRLSLRSFATSRYDCGRNAEREASIRDIQTHVLTHVLFKDRLYWLFPNAFCFYERVNAMLGLKRGSEDVTDLLYDSIFSPDVSVFSKKKWIHRHFCEVFHVYLYVLSHWFRYKRDDFDSPERYAHHMLETFDFRKAESILNVCALSKPDPSALTCEPTFKHDFGKESAFLKSLDCTLSKDKSKHASRLLGEYATKVPGFDVIHVKTILENLSDVGLLSKTDFLLDRSESGGVEHCFEPRYATLERKRFAETCFKDIYLKEEGYDGAIFTISEPLRVFYEDTLNAMTDERQKRILNTMLNTIRSFVVGLPGTGKTYCARAYIDMFERVFVDYSDSATNPSLLLSPTPLKNTLTLTLTGSMCGELQHRGFKNCKNICLFCFDVFKLPSTPSEWANLKTKEGRFKVCDDLEFDDGGIYTLILDEFSNVSDQLYYVLMLALEKLKKALATVFCKSRVFFKIVYMMDCLQIQPIEGDSLCKSIYNRGYVFAENRTNEDRKAMLFPLIKPHRFKETSGVYLCDVLIVVEEETLKKEIKRKTLDTLFRLCDTSDAMTACIDSGLCYRVSQSHVKFRKTMETFFEATFAFDHEKSNGHVLALTNDDCKDVNNVCKTLNPNRTVRNASCDFVRNDRIIATENMYNSRTILRSVFFQKNEEDSLDDECRARLASLFKDLYNGRTYTFFGLVGFLKPPKTSDVRKALLSVSEKYKQQTIKDGSGSKKLLNLRSFIVSNAESLSKTIRKEFCRNFWFDATEPPDLTKEIESFVLGKKFDRLRDSPDEVTKREVYFERTYRTYFTPKGVAELNSKHAGWERYFVPVILFDGGKLACPVSFDNNNNNNNKERVDKEFTEKTTIKSLREILKFGWCTTVDVWQGRENKNVLFYSKKKETPTKIADDSEHCFINKSRFHVAVTRSKHSFGVVGDFDYFLEGCCSPVQSYDLEDSLFSRLIMSEQNKKK